MYKNLSMIKWLAEFKCLDKLVPLKLFLFAVFLIYQPDEGFGQIAYRGHLSDLRIHELRNMAERMHNCINLDKNPCDNYYEYVCNRGRTMYSIMGHLPNITELIHLLTELQEDPKKFEAKRKVNDFFISCNTLKSVEDCYRETFEYFKPVFGYIITKNHIAGSVHEHIDFLDILDRFVKKAASIEDFSRNPILERLQKLKEKFRNPHVFFSPTDLDHEYSELQIYRESYEHNLRNLEYHRRRNSTYEIGMQRIMLDWSLYVYQSRNKPMSYYFPTFNVHLWMTLYNYTVRFLEPKRIYNIGDCLNLPQYVNVLEEARILAIVYLKSFNHAWQDYIDWIALSDVNRAVFDQENSILGQHNITNKHIFYTLFAQNFCDFGKELSENIFFLGLKYNSDFFTIYSCGYQTEQRQKCI